jgi:aspartate/methionine/tyrosine aminotransferase
VLAQAAARLQSQMTSCITSFVYPAIVQALEHGAADVERMRLVFAQRARLIHGLVGRWPGVVCPRPTGAFYVFPDVSATFGRTTPRGARIDSAESFTRLLLEEARVAVVPGDEFGDCARSHVRLSFAMDEAAITEGCRRIEAWWKSLR